MKYGYEKKKSNKAKVIATIALFLLTMLVLLVFILKNRLLDIAVHKVQTRLKDKYNMELSFGAYRLNGLSNVQCQKILCSTPDKDTLIYLERAEIQIRLLPLLTASIRLSEMNAENGIIKLQYLKQFRHKKENTEADSTDKFGRIKRYADLFEKLSSTLPSAFSMKNINLVYKDTADDLFFKAQTLRYKDEDLNGDFKCMLNGEPQHWELSGKYDKDRFKGNFRLRTDEAAFINSRKLRRKLKSDIALREINIELEEFDNETDNINIRGKFSLSEMQLVNKKISADTIKIAQCGMNYQLNLDTGMFALDSSSSFNLNGLVANMGIYWQYKEPKSIKICMNMQPVAAQKFLEALPEASFDKVKTMQMEGKLSYHLGFYLQMPKYDSVYVNSTLKGEGLKIIDYGEASLNKLNTSFTYIPFNSHRHITVGEDNPEYVSLDTISHYLKDVVINSEDGDFFYNKGFNEDAIGQSIVQNLRSGSFRKGGSTISMQLVKNVFLSHKKTIDRKLEEAMMTWLIENLHIVSKKRMFEVYLNIIEWGPDVYGVNEASHFYFNKHPSQLTLDESVFLGLIIPSPKGYMYYFDDKGHLKKHVQGYYNLITGKMAAYGKIDKAERDTIPFDIKLKGPAQNLLKIKDTTGIDTLDDWNDRLIE